MLAEKKAEMGKILAHLFRRIKNIGPVYVIGSYLLAICYALVVCVPGYYVFVSSFKENSEIFGAPLALPAAWGFDWYVQAISMVNLFDAMGVSLVICAVTLIVTLIVGFMAAYAIARVDSPLGKLAEISFGASFLIPVFALIVPIFLMSVHAGLYRKPTSVIIYYTAASLPITVLLLSSLMRVIPRDLEESAEIDGANVFQIIIHIIFPLTRSGVVTVTILNFLHVWNEYLFALILLDPNHPTVQVVLPLLRSQYKVDYGLIAAGLMISVLPVYLLFIVFQERIVQGMFQGAIKG